MKKFLYFFLFLLSQSLLGKFSISESRIEKIKTKYQHAVNVLQMHTLENQLKDEQIVSIFQEVGFFSKLEALELSRSLAFLKKYNLKKERAFVKHKKSVNFAADKAKSEELRSFIAGLQKLQRFLVEYGSSYYAFITHQEIARYYAFIDEKNLSGQQLVTHLPATLGISPTGRWLYFLVKKIDIDLRRLTELFRQDIASQELAGALAQTKEKLLHVRQKIVTTHLYRAQLRKTRWLKFIGAVVVPVCLITFIVLPIVAMVNCGMPVVVSPVYFISWLAMYPLMCIPVTVHESREASQYNIPVHSHSLFSYFRPSFILLTWIPRD